MPFFCSINIFHPSLLTCLLFPVIFLRFFFCFCFFSSSRSVHNVQKTRLFALDLGAKYQGVSTRVVDSGLEQTPNPCRPGFSPAYGERCGAASERSSANRQPDSFARQGAKAIEVKGERGSQPHLTRANQNLDSPSYRIRRVQLRA